MHRVFTESRGSCHYGTRPHHGRLVTSIYLLYGDMQHQANNQRRTVVVLWCQASSELVVPVPEIIACMSRGMDRVNSRMQYGNSTLTSVYLSCAEDNDNDQSVLDIVDADFITGLWQQSAFANKVDFRVKSQYLLILWTFFTDIELNDVVFSANTIRMYLGSCLQQAEAASRSQARAPMEDIWDFFFRDILTNVFTPPSCRKPASNIDAESLPTLQSTTIRLTVQLFLLALSSHAVENLLRSALHATKDAVNKIQLQKLFISLVVDVYDALSIMFSGMISDFDGQAENGLSASLPTLVDGVISLLYCHKRFAALQPEIFSLFKCPQVLTSALNRVFQVFTAQVRETIIASVTTQKQRLRGGCKYRSLLEPGSVQVRDIYDRDVLSNIKMAEIAQFIREFGCIDLEIGENALCLSLLSVFSFSDGMSASPMKLVLNERLRVFRVLPSGASSMITTVGGWSIGDYMGLLSDDAQSVDIDLFAYKEIKYEEKDQELMTGEVTMVRQIRLSLRLEKEQHSNFMSQDPSNTIAIVDGMVYASTTGWSRKLFEISTAKRGEIWNAVEWSPFIKSNVGFIAVRNFN
ncbi:hypothetical protein F441_01949 [Phytophthora nicotianae CJ01A1]|uniref:Uncharacterized protein n=3 Tax=Phytophthora nicotianae TaxID=4792 RepID=W3A1T4_PHYNI|nr:hypothetical protein F444_01984 [Phytophthora nicotianae P1976]ETP25148.1 hypothetical protein F441_01949 [Phytophthora nicotianae CJ01A1]ETP53141.1 hypothetical protein F442_01924 [Phytophthora nicotianae P10297]